MSRCALHWMWQKQLCHGCFIFSACCRFKPISSQLRWTEQWTMASNEGKAVISSIDYFWCFSWPVTFVFLLGRDRVDKRRSEVLLSCQMSFKMISCSEPLFSCPAHVTSHLVMFIFLWHSSTFCISFAILKTSHLDLWDCLGMRSTGEIALLHDK